MHDRQSPRRQVGEFPYSRSGVRRYTTGVKEFLGPFCGLDNVAVRQCRAISGVGKEISAEQRACGFFK